MNIKQSYIMTGPVFIARIFGLSFCYWRVFCLFFVCLGVYQCVGWLVHSVCKLFGGCLYWPAEQLNTGVDAVSHSSFFCPFLHHLHHRLLHCVAVAERHVMTVIITTVIAIRVLTTSVTTATKFRLLTLVSRRTEKEKNWRLSQCQFNYVSTGPLYVYRSMIPVICSSWNKDYLPKIRADSISLMF